MFDFITSIIQTIYSIITKITEVITLLSDNITEIKDIIATFDFSTIANDYLGLYAYLVGQQVYSIQMTVILVASFLAMVYVATGYIKRILDNIPFT